MFLATLLVAGGLTAFHASVAPAIVGIYYITTLLLGGPLGEEPGWRGFALPRLQRQAGPLWGTLILGMLWGLWHLPLYLRPVYLAATGVQEAGTSVAGLSVAFVGSLLALTALAVIFTWVFNHTRGSLLLMMLLAASLNTGGLFVTLSFPSLSQTLVFDTPALNLILDLVPLVPALLLIALTRGQLGYHHYRHEAEALDLPSSMQEQVA